MISEFGKRLLFAVAIAAVAAVAAYFAPPAERFFAAVLTIVGLSMLLLSRPSIPLQTRLQRIGKWDVIAPALLCAAAALTDSENSVSWIRFYIYGSVFFIGLGTGLSLLFRAEEVDSRQVRFGS
ncbi:MAG TPA: hypothetical protein DEP03_12985 [Massilia sp.]|nr:hypothetical protein [Massilia sp.]